MPPPQRRRPQTTTTATAASGARPGWAPDPQDVAPQVKQAAAGYVQTTVNPPVQVVFGQYGGLLTSSASVLVVTHPWPAVADPAAGSTYDVRLVRTGAT